LHLDPIASWQCFGVPFKKTVNISTVRATPETRAKLDRVVKGLGFRSKAHFFTRSMETLLEQLDAGQSLRWPLRFEEKKEDAPKAPTRGLQRTKKSQRL
jgi:hypothetical protein